MLWKLPCIASSLPRPASSACRPRRMRRSPLASSRTCSLSEGMQSPTTRCRGFLEYNIDITGSDTDPEVLESRKKRKQHPRPSGSR